MNINLEELAVRAKKAEKENKKYLQKLKKKKPKSLDVVIHSIHEEVFDEVDCLQCANCCKTTGPLFTNADIKRISKFLKIKEQQFITSYLRLDEDNDYVLQRLPCVFLDAQNYCSIYAVRPKACSEYPHTNRKKFHQITNLTLKNMAICPAAFKIIAQLKVNLKL